MPMTSETATSWALFQTLRGVIRLYPKIAGILFCFLISGCASKAQPGYQNAEGFRFMPPVGWVERMRDDLLPAKAASRRMDVPLPAIDASGKSGRERLLVRYDRLTSSRHAWLRITVGDMPTTVSLRNLLVSRTPGPSWKRESEPETLQVAGRPAERVAFAGRWNGDEFINETVAIRKDSQVYLITATFPAQDAEARDQVREAVTRASWQ